MRVLARSLWFVAAALLCGGLPAVANATTYSFQNISAPYSPGYTVLTGINDNGDAVGQYLANGSSGQGFLYSGGAFSLIPSSPDYPRTYVYGINTSSIIVGSVSTNAGDRGFIYDGSGYSYISEPDASAGTSVNAINNSGNVVGVYGDFGGHGFLYSGGSFVSLDDPDATGDTYAASLNNDNVVVGYYQDLNIVQPHGFIYKDGLFETIDAPGADSNGTQPMGINDQGQIGGNYGCGGGNYCGFLYLDGVWETIEYPLGAGSATIRGINNLGQIVGYYSYQGQEVGFIGTPVQPGPVPEPSVWALMLAGVGAIGALTRRHRAQVLLIRA
jgi:hypothetical protein